ncbi:MAG: hypothetical protein FD165_492 [Gammaproteobacteria bacterium]|nr:MAG: hypothetical protein FD165_492 [Gammaproteobacteria bacterium]TND02246.1 MAG: hypothetical protein FD120_2410 [Gammaproteobacteria bacterium]
MFILGFGLVCDSRHDWRTEMKSVAKNLQRLSRWSLEVSMALAVLLAAVVAAGWVALQTLIFLTAF